MFWGQDLAVFFKMVSRSWTPVTSYVSLSTTEIVCEPLCPAQEGFVVLGVRCGTATVMP